MLSRLIFTISTAACLTGMYLGYATVMRPIVVTPEPDVQQAEKEVTRIQRPPENARVATKFISPQTWAANSQYMLRAGEGFLYADSCLPDETNNKRMTFKPFAIVWLMKDKDGKEQALSVESKSAMVEFASKLDEKNQNPGRIVGAVLNGKVYISGPDNLLVEGSDFHFEEAGQTLYSHHPVKFKYLSHQGSATRIQMKLIPGEGPPGNDRPHIYGVESIHLSGTPNQYDPKSRWVDLKMELPQGNTTQTVRARCSGELTYLVATNTAILTTDVIAQTGTKPFHTLECDKLTMQFEPKRKESVDTLTEPSASAVSEKKKPSEFQSVETDLEFSWLEAVEGKYAPVKIKSPSNGIVATMARLTYSEESRTIFMSSENSPRDVEINRNGSTLKVPAVNIELDEERKNVDSLLCLGKGELKYFDEASGKLTYVAEWQNHLRKLTDAATKLDLIELDGNAQFRQPKPNPKLSSGLLAERIKIWMAPMDFSLPSDDQEAAVPDPEPKRILAEHEVALKSPQLEIKRTEELDIQFEDEPGTAHILSRHESNPPHGNSQSNVQRLRGELRPSGLIISERPQDQRRQVRSDKSQKPPLGPSSQIGFASVKPDPLGSLGPPIDIPFEERPARKQKSRSDPLQSAGRTSVTADRIEVRVRRVAGSQEMQPKNVVAQGKVKISQERQPNEKPLTLSGDRVDLKMETQERLIADVSGVPALIRDPQFEIEGKQLHLDRGANRAWVDGAGLLTLPIPAEHKIPGMDPSASRDLVVRWDDAMNFDGLKADFQGNVEAKLGHARMTCGHMIAQLVQRISFQQQTLESEPALRSIRCSERVKFENSTYKDKNLIEVYRGKVGDFTLNYAAGTVEAQGPGEVFAWQRHEKNGGLMARDTIQANRPITTEVTVWDYTHLQFEGQLKGNYSGQSSSISSHQHVVVTDRVEMVYGPVKWIIDQIDPDNLPPMSGTMRCGKLEFDNYPKTDNNPTAYHTFVGRQNAEIEGHDPKGRQFTAAADEISFDESKDLYKIRAYGKQNARITGMSPNSLTGRQLQFNPITKMLKVEHAVEAQGSQ